MSLYVLDRGDVYRPASLRTLDHLKRLLSRPEVRIIAVAFLAALVVGLVYASMDFSHFRDNIRYVRTYERIHGVFPVKGYHYYSESSGGVGAPEPLSFLFLYLGANSVPWSFFILVKSFFLSFSVLFFLARMGAFRNSPPALYLLLGVVLCSDYYLCRMFFELHKLGLSIAVLLFLAAVSRKNTFSGFCISVFTHFQMVFLFPLVKFDQKQILWWGRVALIGLLAIFLNEAVLHWGTGIPWYKLILRKVTYYYHDSHFVLSDLKYIALILVFICGTYFLRRDFFMRVLLLGILTALSGALLGFERLFFPVYWGAVSVILFSAMPVWKKAAGVSPFVLYNIYRISIFMAMSHSVSA